MTVAVGDDDGTGVVAVAAASLGGFDVSRTKTNSEFFSTVRSWMGGWFFFSLLKLFFSLVVGGKIKFLLLFVWVPFSHSLLI